MDFRQVEKKFRLAALLIQVVLCSFLLCFLGFSFKQILDSTADPPVETTTVQWRKGLGFWALCSQSSGSLFGVGTASESEVWGYHDREKALAGAQLSEPEIMNFSLSLSRFSTPRSSQLFLLGFDKCRDQDPISFLVVHRFGC